MGTEIIDNGALPAEQKVDWGPAPVEASREQILTAIDQTENPAPEVPTQAPVAPEPTEPPISPVQAEGQEKETEPSTTPATPPNEGQPPKVDTPALTEQQLQDVLAKKHIAPQDAYKLAKMYLDAQKALTQKSMEAAALRRTVPVAQPISQPVQSPGISPVTGLQYVSTDPNAQILEDLQQNPILTLRKVAEVAYGPQMNSLSESLNEQRLHNTVVKLSTSPDTAEFNLPIVQDEIKVIMSERPELSGNLSENLPILNDLAIGRLYRAGKLNKDAVEAGKQIAEQNLATRRAATMETGVKAAAPVTKEFRDMSVEEQGAYLKSIISGM